MPYVHVDIDEIIDHLSRSEYDDAVKKGIEKGKLRIQVDLFPDALKAAGCPENIWRPVKEWVDQPELNLHHLAVWNKFAGTQ